MRVGVAGVQGDGVAIAHERTLVAAEIVVNVAEVEVRFEAFRVERDGALVQRLGLDTSSRA